MPLIAKIVKNFGRTLNEREQAHSLPHGSQLSCGIWVRGPGYTVRRQK